MWTNTFVTNSAVGAAQMTGERRSVGVEDGGDCHVASGSLSLVCRGSPADFCFLQYRVPPTVLHCVLADILEAEFGMSSMLFASGQRMLGDA